MESLESLRVEIRSGFVASVALVGLAALAGMAVGGPLLAESGLDTGGSARSRMAIVHGCWGDEHGHLSGGRFLVPDTLGPAEPADLGMIETRGNEADNRVDLVIVGDGYTAGELGLYRADAARIADDFFRYEPFIRYEPYFRVTAVDVVSTQSGVDNDPAVGVSRNTALDMAYWCNDIERLLCVNVSKARSFAFAGAPDVDQILAIANSSKYGGAGYSSQDLGTAAGQNSSAVEIAIHEMGHSLGNLADEYTYGGPSAYAGGEPTAANLSRLTASQMASAGSKWSGWLNASVSGFDNPVGTYEGGGYSETGVYRPSNNSMMRSLGRRFNLPSAEVLIREFYREVSPIDMAPANGTSFGIGDVVSIVPMRPNGSPLRIEWLVDGVVVESASGAERVSAGRLGLAAGSRLVEVRVTDDTPWVRSAAIRSGFLTDGRFYTMTGCAAYGDFNGDLVLDLADISAFVAGFVAGDDRADLATPAGVFDLRDITAFVDAFTGGCL